MFIAKLDGNDFIKVDGNGDIYSASVGTATRFDTAEQATQAAKNAYNRYGSTDTAGYIVDIAEKQLIFVCGSMPLNGLKKQPYRI